MNKLVMSLTPVIALINQGFATEELSIKSVVIADFACQNAMGNTCYLKLRLDQPMLSMANMYKQTDVVLVNFCHEKTREFTNNVIDMHNMFLDARKLIYLNLSNLDTGKVTNMENMFKGCINLKEINVSGFDTSNVKSMKGMFAYCQSLEQLDISNFDMSNVKSCDYMFLDCEELNILKLPLSEKKTPHINKNAYSGCEILTTIYYK